MSVTLLPGTWVRGRKGHTAHLIKDDKRTYCGWDWRWEYDWSLKYNGTYLKVGTDATSGSHICRSCKKYETIQVSCPLCGSFPCEPEAFAGAVYPAVFGKSGTEAESVGTELDGYTCPKGHRFFVEK